MIWKKAKAVWLPHTEEGCSQFAGFTCKLNLSQMTRVKMKIAARSYYRLFVNGEMKACGPARAAKNHCRVDELEFILPQDCYLAIEVAAYSKTEQYCNDCTMEGGLLAAEITDEAGIVLAATGDEHWTCEELFYRRARVQTMSHCRGIIEYYDLKSDSYSWCERLLSEKPVVLEEKVIFQKRRAPYPSYERRMFQGPVIFYDVRLPEIEKEGERKVTMLASLVNPKWYRSIPKENLFLEELCREHDFAYTGKYRLEGSRWERKLIVEPKDDPAAVLWKLPESAVGFLDFTVAVDKKSVIDVLNSDVLNEKGELCGNTYVTRYQLEPGKYHLTTFEPKLVHYMKIIVRSEGTAQFSVPKLIEDNYPDSREADFSCSDGDLNRIYEASRKTLRLNTLDIFMDCPERERGGWLCDSYFTAKGAWQMFGDLSVEKDFLENFMQTEAKAYWKGFFPEVYPGVNGNAGEVGIRNWSFWLALELCDYYERSGDLKFVEACKNRMEQFVEGVLSLRGESGLLEHTGTLFVDWSLSNESFAIGPISIPVNCLAVCMLEKLSVLYTCPAWKRAAEEMRKIIEELNSRSGGLFAGKGDGATFDTGTGRLTRGSCRTESGIALEIWSGFHQKDEEYRKAFVERMGSCPRMRPDPNIGRANLFIGLMVRFDTLARMGKVDTLIREWKDLYLEELLNGSGTLFEGIADQSGCHGFNGYVGAMMTNLILGLGSPMQSRKTVRISPHPGDLYWAMGSALCEDGRIDLQWAADHEKHELAMKLYLPDGWAAEYDIPFELSGWNVEVNGKKL